MMLPFSRHIEAVCTVYDCMDELANFRFAPPQLLELERELLAAPTSSSPAATASTRRRRTAPQRPPLPVERRPRAFRAGPRDGRAPDDQARCRRPRFGFYGVIDERMDLELIAASPTRIPNGRSSWSGRS
jgi:UDP-galactopyranose mutase